LSASCSMGMPLRACGRERQCGRGGDGRGKRRVRRTRSTGRRREEGSAAGQRQREVDVPVPQDARLAVNERDGRLDDRRVLVARVEDAKPALRAAREGQRRSPGCRMKVHRYGEQAERAAGRVGRGWRRAQAHLDLVLGPVLPLSRLAEVELLEGDGRDSVVLDWDVDRLARAVVCGQRGSSAGVGRDVGGGRGRERGPVTVSESCGLCGSASVRPMAAQARLKRRARE